MLRRGGPEYAALLAEKFVGEEPPGARQMVELTVESVQTSCGYAVPNFEYVADRPSLDNWALAKGEAELEAYRREKNERSIDGLPTGMFAEDTEPVS